MTRIFTIDVIALKKLMVENNINSISELANRTGINRNTLGQVLNEEIQPTTYVMDKLVHVLNIKQEEAGKIFFSNNLRNT